MADNEVLRKPIIFQTKGQIGISALAFTRAAFLQDCFSLYNNVLTKSSQDCLRTAVQPVLSSVCSRSTQFSSVPSTRTTIAILKIVFLENGQTLRRNAETFNIPKLLHYVYIHLVEHSSISLVSISPFIGNLLWNNALQNMMYFRKFLEL